MTRCWDVLEMNGLESGEDALRVNMMAELLTNVFLLGGCLDYFDGVPTPWVWTATWPWSPSTLMRESGDEGSPLAVVIVESAVSSELRCGMTTAASPYEVDSC